MAPVPLPRREESADTEKLDSLRQETISTATGDSSATGE
jgi:hypothetical protein